MKHPSELVSWCRQRGISLDEARLPKLVEYLDRLAEAGERTNLTRVMDREAMIERHLGDSLLFGPLLGADEELSVVDLGCGAGLPSVPLALLHRGWQFYGVDSVRRKIDFLLSLRSSLDLPNFHPLHVRLEDLGHDPEHRERHDACCARACGPLPAVLEYAFPLLKPGGRLVVATTQRVYEEAGAVDSIVERLGGGCLRLRPYHLAGEGGRDFLHLLFDKGGQTPSNYPRKPKQMAKKPLS